MKLVMDDITITQMAINWWWLLFISREKQQLHTQSQNDFPSLTFSVSMS